VSNKGIPSQMMGDVVVSLKLSHPQSSATVSLSFCKKTKHRGNPFGRKAILLIVEADAQLLSGFPEMSEDLVQFPVSIISIRLPIN
jgi:hypothetical protein